MAVRDEQPFGFLVIDKPAGMTSHDVVAHVRRGTRVRQVGHAGTLDPMATGVLVVCVGAATRLSEYVMASTKLYVATVRLGVETDTYDAEGRIMQRYPVDHLTTEAVEVALARFQGEQDQVPPMFSAIKQGGTKLYTLARQGVEVARPPRRVWMETLLLDCDLPAMPDIRLAVACSAGTYIRSLAHDLGAMLGVGGHLVALRRLRSGALFRPVAWDDLCSALEGDRWRDLLLDERAALPHIPALDLTADEAGAVLHGRPIVPAEPPSGAALRRAYAPGGRFIAILAHRDHRWQPVKVFPMP